MNAQIYSLYWDNVDPALVEAQQAVFKAMQIPVNQHRINGMRHGEWIDWVMTRNDTTDVFLFIDIDCVPLSKEAVMRGIEKAASGTLYGAEGTANHIDATRSYVGAWYAFINRKTWDVLGRPSAKETPHTDVLQLWSDTWRQAGAPVELIAPTAAEQPEWDLPGRPKAYGIGTTYGEECYHLFEARAGTRGLFLDRCQKILTSLSAQNGVEGKA